MRRQGESETEATMEMPRVTSSPATGSVFDGVWRPDYPPPGPDAAPDVISFDGRFFECRSCNPPYRAPADGRDHAVQGNPRFATIAITVVDDWTVRQVGRRGGAVVFESTMVVAADGSTMTETRTAVQRAGDVLVPIASKIPGDSREGPRFVRFGMGSVRVGPAEVGAHLVSGRWRVVEQDLVDHDEDTSYQVVDASLRMSDRMGRSFQAPLDGTIAPYQGDPRFTAVTVRMVDDRTIEESNLSGGDVVQVTHWQVDPDGRTMHVRFDDTHGHVMEQTGHKLP
jgi:hypothetical protein